MSEQTFQYTLRKNSGKFDQLETHQDVPFHPLSSSVTNSANSRPINKEKNEVKYDFFDPLGVTSTSSQIEKQDEDLLHNVSVKSTSFSLENTLKAKHGRLEELNIVANNFISWRDFRQMIFDASNPDDPDKKRKTNLAIKQFELLQNNGEDYEEERNIKINRLNEIKVKMVDYWQRDLKVETKDLVIEACNMMAKVDPTSSDYAYLWVHVTDICDSFGLMAYNRIMSLVNDERKSRNKKPFGPNDTYSFNEIPQDHQLKARNYFQTVNSVKIPCARFYYQVALYPLKRLIGEVTYEDLEDLLMNCEQYFIEDVSTIYGRLHLSRYIKYLLPNDTSMHNRIYRCWIERKSVTRINMARKELNHEVKNQKVKYLAMGWIIQCATYRTTEFDALDALFGFTGRTPQDENSYILHCAAMVGLSGEIIKNNWLDIAGEIYKRKVCADVLLGILGKRLFDNPPDSLEGRAKITSTIWPKITNFADFKNIIDCAAAWAGFCCRYNKPDDMKEHVFKRILHEFNLDLSKIRDEDNLESLLNLAESFVKYAETSEQVWNVIEKTQYISMVDKIAPVGKSRARLARTMLEAIVRCGKVISIHRNSELTLLTGICKDLFANNSNIYEDEVRVNGELVVQAIKLIDVLKVDKKTMLHHLTVLRSDIGRCDIVLYEVVKCMITFYIHFYSSTQHSTNQRDNTRDIIGFLATTIPSIRDVKRRMKLTVQLLRICVAMNNIPQAEAQINRLVKDFKEVGLEPISVSTASILSSSLSLLCQMPVLINREEDPLILFYQIFTFVEHEKVKSAGCDPIYAQIYINMLRYLVHIAINQGQGEITQKPMQKILRKLESFSTTSSVVACMVYETYVGLFEIDDEIRAALRSLIKHAHRNADENVRKRLGQVAEEIGEEAKHDETVKKILVDLDLDE